MSEYETVRKDGKVRNVHDVLAEGILGQPLDENEVVHHVNGNKHDNREENLRVMDRAEHWRLHPKVCWRKIRIKEADRGKCQCHQACPMVG